MSEEPQTVATDTNRARGLSLFRFLHDLTELRTKAIRTIDEYQREGRVLWFDEIPREPECSSIAWREAGHREEDSEDDAPEVWIEIDRPRLSPVPQPPAALEPWLDSAALSDSSLPEPGLLLSFGSGIGFLALLGWKRRNARTMIFRRALRARTRVVGIG